MLKRFLIAVLLMGTVVTGAVAETIVDRIVAVANGEIITLFDLDERLKPMLARFEGKPMGEAEQRAVRDLRRQLLDAMVDDILINQEAERLGVEVSDVEVENQIKQVRQRNGLTPEQFEDQLLLEGMTREMYTRKVREDILKHRIIGFMVKRKVVITDEEIEAYYNAHPEEFRREKTVRLSLLVVDTKEQAETLRARIVGGEIGFADAARQYSVGPYASDGGSIGGMAWQDLGPEWKQAVSGLDEQEIASPFELNGKWVLLRLDGTASSGTNSLDAVREEIREQLYRPRLEERFKEYMEELRSKAVVDVRL